MKYLLLIISVVVPVLVHAQDDYYQQRPPSPIEKQTYSILLKDGTQLRGELIRQDSTEAIIRTKNVGTITLKSDQIVRMERIGAQAKSETYPNGFPQTMRILPTAYSAERSKLYFRNYMLYASQFEYGITDNWSVGTTFYTFLPTNLFSFNTKLSFPVGQRVRLGINAQYAAIRFPRLFLNGGFGGIGYVQGLVTAGDRQNNATYGLGWSISNGSLSRNIVGSFGLVRKVSPKLTFISENLILLGGNIKGVATALSGGIRFDRSRHAFDLAAYLPLFFGPNVETTTIFVPFASYHLRISK
jgi:hypothetical protein